MIARAVKAVAGWFGGSRSWWLLLAVAAIGAGIYAWGAEQRADRDRLADWGEMVCVSAATKLQSTRGARGAACAAAIADLAAFKRDTIASTAALTEQALAKQAEKTSADIAAARAAARDARAAADMMEKANAQIGPDDRVARDWFVALNHAGGLRAPAR